MTFTLKSEHVNDYYIYVDQDKFSSLYKVGICKCFSSGLAKTISELTYTDYSKASKRFSFLKRKAKNMEV